MKKLYRILFVQSNETKTTTDLGVTLGKYKAEGLGWCRAYQLLNRDMNGHLPHGKIQFEPINIVPTPKKAFVKK